MFKIFVFKTIFDALGTDPYDWTKRIFRIMDSYMFAISLQPKTLDLTILNIPYRIWTRFPRLGLLNFGTISLGVCEV